jgi:hypothetical protein
MVIDEVNVEIYEIDKSCIEEHEHGGLFREETSELVHNEL